MTSESERPKIVSERNISSPIGDGQVLQHMVAESLAVESDSIKYNRRLYKLIRPIFAPTLIGQENIPDTPVLLVGNHALFAMDVPLIQSTFLHESGRLVRAMADKVLFSNGFVRKQIIRQGGILGDPVVCSAMMEAKKDLLVFPGGSYEVNKPADQRYQLKWKERYGFVRLAAHHGYTILPVATVGPDEFYGRYLESDQWAQSWLFRSLQKYHLLEQDVRSDLLPPLPRGLFGTLLPKPQRFYMSVGEPIDLARHRNEILSSNKLSEIRQKVAASIECQIKELLLFRARNAEKESWWRRQLTR